MATHDRYDTDVLRTLQCMANSLEHISKRLERISDEPQIYSTADYAKEHPEWAKVIKAIAHGKED
jgi:hypothetical protein